MSLQQTATRRSWKLSIPVVLMSISAPLLAACIHSTWVFHRGYGLYNAEIGGEFFNGTGNAQPFILQLLFFVSACGIPAIPTFIALLIARKKYRWLVWSGSVVLWVYVCFMMEITYR